MRDLMVLTQANENTFVEIPDILLSVSVILSTATKNALEITTNGFTNTDFSIDDPKEMAKQHRFYYKGK